MKEALGFLQNCYRGRSYRVYIVNAPTGITFLWNIAKLALDQNTIDKINITDKPHNPKMLTHINKFNLEQRFGGEAPNLTAPFW